MSAQKNKNRRTRRKSKRKAPPAWLTQVKTFLVSISLGALSALGFWQCLDEGSMPPLDPVEAPHSEPVRKIDVGKNLAVDPTLVDEQKLLEAEMPSVEQPPEQPVEKEEQPVTEEGAPPETPTVEEQEEARLERLFPMHAVAFHFHTQIHAKPERDSRVIAYARRGMTFRVGEKLSTKGCAKGWHEISPGNLFICAGKGAIVSDEEVSFAPSPPPPNSETPLPYDYAFITADNTPQYWRLPTEQESEDVQALFERIATRSQKNQQQTELASALVKAGEIAAEADGGPIEDEPPADAAPAKEAVTLAPDGGVVDPYALPPFVYMRMNRGYYVSRSSTARSKSGFQSTIRGRLIPADKLAPAKPTTFEGLLLDGAMSLPRVFVVGGGVKLLRQKEEGGSFKSIEKVARLSDHPFIGELKRRNRRYVQVGDNLFLSSRVAAVVRMAKPPEDLKPNERWIDIDLSEQTLVAYEGERPVFATLVSTGRKGFETPTGAFRVYSKHVTITMDDTEAGEEAYSIEDIPWTQYFEEGYALHTAFWHTRFGRVRSHGCINLAPADAHRLFFWTGPHVPDGIHGIVATRENKGTRIVIHE